MSSPSAPRDLPADLAAVQADDALLDALGDDPTPSDADVARALLAWRRDVDAAPIPCGVDVDTALAIVRARSRRSLAGQIMDAVRRPTSRRTAVTTISTVTGVGFESPYPAAVTQTSPTGWRLLATVTYHGSTQTFAVPYGQETDLASTPRTLRALFPPYGSYTAAVILHDWLWRVEAPAGRLTYRDADGLLRQAMGTLGVPPVRRWAMWAAVRWGALLTRRGGHRGWWRDAPKVLGMTVVVLPLVVAPVVANASSLLLLALMEAVVGLLGRRPTRDTEGGS